MELPLTKEELDDLKSKLSAGPLAQRDVVRLVTTVEWMWEREHRVTPFPQDGPLFDLSDIPIVE